MDGEPDAGTGVAAGDVAEPSGDGVPLGDGLGDPERLGVRDADGDRDGAGADGRVEAGVPCGTVGVGFAAG